MFFEQLLRINMVNKILDTYLRTLQKQAFYKAASMVYTPGYGLQDIINAPTQKEEAPAPQPTPPQTVQPLTPQPQNSNVAPPPAAPVPNQQPAVPKRVMQQSKATPPTPNVDIAVPNYNVGTDLNLPEAIDIGGDLPEPLPDNSLGIPADVFKNTSLDNPEVRKALAEQEQIRKQYEANALKVERKRKANRNYTQRVMDAEKKRHLAGVARTDIDAATGKYIGQQEAAGNVLPVPTPKPDPQVGSNAYSDPEAAYKMFLRRGNTPEQARAAADAIRTYNQQIGLGADHKTAMDIVNSSFSPDLPIEYEAQLIDRLNRQYRMNQNRQYINPQYSEAQALEDSRRQAARDNNRFLNPSDYTNTDRLRGATTYVSHGRQVVNPRTGRINSKATTRKQRASNRRRADAAANAAGLRWSPTRGTYVYG